MKIKKFFKRLFATVLVGTSIFSMTACRKSDKKEEGEPFVLEADAYDMGEATDKFLADMLDSALSSAKSFAVGKLKSFAIEKSIWAAKGILKSMGYEITEEKSFNDILLERLDDIKSEIVNLEGKIDWLTSSYSDSQYLTKYNEFIEEYRRVTSDVKVVYESLQVVEENIKAGSEKNLDADLNSLCSKIQGTSISRSDFDTQMTNLGNYFIGSTTSTEKLQTYSILNIAERFVCSQTPYKENRYEQIKEILADSITTYFISYVLVTMNYGRMLNSLGIKEIWMNSDYNVVAYTTAESSTIYLNCLEAQKDTFVQAYKGMIDGNLENAEAMTINNYNSNSILIAGYLSNVTKQYNAVAKLYYNFISKYETTETSHLTLSSSSQYTDRTVKTLAPANFLSTNAKGEVLVDYSKFGNISRSDFVAYAKTIEPYANVAESNGAKKSLTFKEYFVREGYKFPTNNASSVLVLGAAGGYKDYVTKNNGWGTFNDIAIYCVDLNQKISDFVKNNTFVIKHYGLYKSYKNNTCSKDDETWYVYQGKEETVDSHAYYMEMKAKTLGGSWTDRGGFPSAPTTYYTIIGLSTHPRNDTAGKSSISF